MSLIPLDFPEDQYYKVEHPKRQIVLHFTVSPNSRHSKLPGYKGDVRHWLSTRDRVATCNIIDADGATYELFESKYWAHHLGVKRKVFTSLGLPSINTKLNQKSIGIELDSFGPLNKLEGKYYSIYGHEVDEDYVIEFPTKYRGKQYYEKFSKEQIESLCCLLQDYCHLYEIPTTYQAGMFEISKEALKGVPGIWSHTSFRSDKFDVMPQPELIEMLQDLSL